MPLKIIIKKAANEPTGLEEMTCRFSGVECSEGLHMSGLEVRGQKIPTPAKENSTAFQLGTDDTKGYAGGSDIVPLANAVSRLQ